MLEFLKIENLALVDRAEIEFRPGFTVVTGETGAGKSVLLGALSMLAGNRCGREIVKNGRDECSVEAVLHFENPDGINALLESGGLPACEDGALVLRRSVHRSKAGKCCINGALATSAALQRLGGEWIDFHGPGEPQKLFSTKCQLDMLDAYSGCGEKASAYRALLSERAERLARIAELKSARRMSPDEIEFARSRIEAIDALNPTAESIAALEASYRLAEGAREITEKSGAVTEILSGDGGAADRLAAALRLARELSGTGEAAETLAARICAAAVEISDISGEFARLADSCAFSEEEEAEIRGRMDAWMELRRKYGPTPEAVAAARAQMAEKISMQGDVGAAIEAERAAASRAEAAMAPLASEIFQARAAAAARLSKKAAALLKKIGFKKPEFRIDVERTAEISASCGSRCEFMFSANPGQPALPLAKIASSGELARVMLAIKATMAQADATALLVFDEVDANVGGEIGAEVGRELAGLAGAHQVFCVTHLPQVAALGQNHFLVKKDQTDTETSVSIEELAPGGQERVRELARMLGDRNSKSAAAHARELLATQNT